MSSTTLNYADWGDILEFARIHPKVEKELEKKFKLLGVINLNNCVGGDSYTFLYNALLPLVKEKYEPNERIIILHFDMDYYIDPVGYAHPGLIITHLQQVISALGIPNYFVLLVTNYTNIAHELEFVQNHYSQDSEVISHVLCDLYEIIINPKNVQTVELNSELICKKYSCLNGNHRPHRDRLVSLLSANNLLEYGSVSYKQTSYLPKDTYKLHDTPAIINDHILVTQPHQPVNQRYNFSKIDKLTNNISLDPIYLDGLSTSVATFNQLLTLQQAFLYVGTETVFQYPHPFLSEKSFKGITVKRPFVVLGAMHTLKRLQSFGFKTFNDYWDEGYDDIMDPADKMLAILDIVKMVCGLPINDLKYMLDDMADILEYNFQHYMNVEDNLLLKFKKNLSI